MNDIADRTPGRTNLDVFRIVAGLRGDLTVGGESWNWDIAYNYGRSRNESEFNQVNLTRRSEAHTSELQSLMRTSYGVSHSKKPTQHRHVRCSCPRQLLRRSEEPT